MKEQKKKRVVVILLLISCFISGYMLFFTSEGQFQKLNNLAQADSLIKKELSDFNIGEQQVNIITTEVDSNLSRKTYYVDVAPAFSKTQLHAELNQIFYSYSIEAPAKVTFPEKDMMIHFLFHNTIIRTVTLQTNSDLVLNRKEASILVVFDSQPGEELIDKLTSFGEPIPIALKIENPMQGNELKKRLRNRYNRILFWLQSDNGEGLIETDPAAAIEKLNQLQSILPSAMMLQFSSSEFSQELSNTNLTFIDATRAIVLDYKMEKESFFKALNQLKTNQPHPLIVIKGNEITLNWLSEKLPDLKKAGVELRPPPPKNF